MKKPPEGLLLRDIGARIGMSHRAMRAWLKAGLLPHTTFRGPQTRYGADVLARAERIRKLRDENLNFEQIQQRLAEEDAAPRPPPPEPVVAPAAPAAPAGGIEDGETWQRIVLVPGLELLVLTRGGPLLRRLAAEIKATYGVAANPRGAPEVA